MSLESKIDTLTAAVVALTQAIQAQQGQVPAAPVAVHPVAQAPVPAPVAPPAPVAAPTFAPVPEPVAAAPAAMPPLPSFAAPVAPAAPAVPFNDGKGLIEFVMAKYKELGPEKGAQIQNVLTGLGYGNINEVKPEHYPAFYNGVLALSA